MVINAVCCTSHEASLPGNYWPAPYHQLTEETSVHLAHHAGQQSHNGIMGQLNPKLLTIIVETERACDKSLLPEDEL